MTKDDWIWVVVKAVGIYILFCAISGFATLLGEGAGLLLVHFFARDERGLGTIAVDRTLQSVGVHIAYALIYMAVSMYFLLSGKLVFRLIARGEKRAKAWLPPQNPEPLGRTPEQPQ